MPKATEKIGMEVSALGQLNTMRSLIETDQKTVDAISQRLALIQDLLKDLVQQIEKRNAEQEYGPLTPPQKGGTRWKSK